MIGYAFCASFCTHSSSLAILEKLVCCGEDVIPIVSERCVNTDTRFGSAKAFLTRIENICKRPVITKLEDAEKFGSITPLERLIISPCTGNTLAKLANGISDGVVTMAAKAHLRCDRPLLISLATNDAMSQNLKNISTLLERKAVYFVPMIQDDPIKKPHSLVADSERFFESWEAMKKGVQLRPIFLSGKA